MTEFVRDIAGKIIADNISEWGGTPLTGRDISLDLANILKLKKHANDYDIFDVDLTVARTDVALNKSGIDLTILAMGGAPWSMKFNSVAKPAISSADLAKGDRFEIEFTEIYFTNAAAAAGTAPAKFYIGKRI